MPAQAELDSIELGVLSSQVGIGDMQPAAGDFEGLCTPPVGDQDAPASAGNEIERGSVAWREIGVGMSSPAAEFHEGRNGPAVHAGIPAKDDGIKRSAGNFLRRELDKNRDKVGCVFQVSPMPTGADLSSEGVADENSRSKDLSF